jgi:hypothetical protein
MNYKSRREMRHRSKLAREWFDPYYPSPRIINEKYKGRIVDLTGKKGITRENVLYAIVTLKSNQALIIPDLNYYDIGSTYEDRKRSLSVPINSASRFRKFGKQIDLVKSNTRIRDIKEQGLTMREAFKEIFSNKEIKKMLVNENYRGIGYWSPRSRRHNIIWFYVPAEGLIYARMFKDEFDTSYLYADAYQESPSYSRLDRTYISPLRVLPVTEEDNEYCVECWETVTWCGCEDAFYMGMSKSKKKREFKLDELKPDMFEAVYKYINPEQAICKHNYAQRLIAEEESIKSSKAKNILAKMPKATGLIRHMYAMNSRVLISGRRPLKAELTSIGGGLHGYCNIEELYDLSEKNYKS